MKKIRAQMEDYEIYRENYEYMKCSPFVQSILRENRELRNTIKTLKKHLTRPIKMEPPSFSGVVDLTNNNEIEIKTIHLTSEPNIVYDLVECVSDSDPEDEEEEDASCASVAEEDASEDEDASCASVAEDAEDAEEVEEEEVDEEEVEEEEEEEEEVEEEEVEEEEVEEEEVEEEEEEEEEVEEEEVEEEEVEEEEVEEEEVEDADASVAEEDAGEEEGVYEVKIKNKTYYVTNETNGTIYAVEADGEVGEEVGKYVDGKAMLTVKKTPTKKL